MSNTEETKTAATWYGKIWDDLEVGKISPRLAPYLDVENLPQYQVKLAEKIASQTMPAISIGNLATPTPETLGLVLGQKCANLYALGDGQTIAAIQQEKLKLEALNKLPNAPGLDSARHLFRVAEACLEELAKDGPRFEKMVHAAFKAALDQTSHQEAVEFFQGFAKGLSAAGLNAGKPANQTDATPVQMKMFLHSKEVAAMKTISELRAFLLKNGFTEQSLGDDQRLIKLCQRLGFSPGKRGRPPKTNK